MEPFQVRLNCIDHYQATPSTFDPPLPYQDGLGGQDNNERPKVPVVRVFGSTETGQKACVHVHGVFPYLYIEYDGSLNAEEVTSTIRSFHLSIDHALAVSYRRDVYDRKASYVAHITLVKGIPFYGYRVGYRFFLKIYLLNPLYITRLADLLLQGAVMKRPFQPYESHLQYIPQWMCDYNLYGCAYMKSNKVTFRSPIPGRFELTNMSHRWHDESIDPDSISDETVLPKQSHCSLEVDVCAQNILNRLDLSERPMHQDFTEYLNSAAFDEKLVPSMAELWKDESRRRKRRLGITDPQSSPFGPEDLVSMSSNPRNGSKGGWIHEAEYRQVISQIASEESSDKSSPITFQNFLERKPFEEQIKTAANSVEDLFQEKLGQSKPEVYWSQNASSQENAEVQVNEQAALSFEHDDNLCNSDDDYFASTLSDEDEDGETNNPANDDPENGLSNMDYQDYESEGKARESDVYGDVSLKPFKDESCGVYATELPPQNTVDDFDFNDRTSLRSVKRPQFEDAPIKKTKFNDENHRLNAMPKQEQQVNVKDNPYCNLPDKTSEGQLSNPKSPFLQDSIRLRRDGQSQRLNFPVVKDPYDPMTKLRFNQDPGSSSKTKPDASQASNKSQNTKSLTDTSFEVSEGVGSSKSQLCSAGAESTVSHTHVSDAAAAVHDSFNIPLSRRLYCFGRPCPLPSDVSSTINNDGRPSVVYQQAYYSDENDVPERKREYAGREFHLKSNSIHHLPDFDLSGQPPAMLGEKRSVPNDRDAQLGADQILRESCRSRVWEFARLPPSSSEVIAWFNNLERNNEPAQHKKEEHHEQELKPNSLSQIEGPTQANNYGFKYSQNGKSTSVESQPQYMSTMSLEIHVNTRGVLAPNPEEDEATYIFWCFHSEDENVGANCSIAGAHAGIISQGADQKSEAKIARAVKIDLEHEPTELDMMTRLVDIVRHYDPDILTGYEIHSSSWGFLAERAKRVYDYDLCDELSRVKSQAHGRFGKESDRWGFTHSSSIRVTGRHMINIWRAMRSELNLLQYTMENVAFHLLHRRIPHYSFQDLTAWYQSAKPRNLLKVVDYFVSRVQMDLEILDSNELISRTSEQARLLGIDFFSVISRGSQFKVESLMFRIAKPENFMLVSPSRKQVGQQNALECLPLIMEPQSDFYTSPVVVLDFQALYPSIMIAYNYCYSTFLGRISHWRGRNKMGFLDYNRQPRLLELLRDKINIAPNGMMYTKPEVRKSLLARMLSEILETRIMVKTGMKADKDDKVLQRLLNNKQLALKLISNVTYGYTSASFSGRMPCSEIADSIVQSGRETLEAAISLIHSVDRWGAEVVYGDTDSLFVRLNGRTREEAFDIGEEIAKAVTEENPHPVKLKFEKIYHPCVLLAKKRYVGYKYDQRGQTEPEFDAKGIETVRRDGTPAEQKIEEKALKILFNTADLSQVKRYIQNQCTKIMQGKVSIQDFCFAREVKLGTYSDKGQLPPGAMISTKRMFEDPRSEPQYGERVPYVVITGAPGSRLIDRCVSPETLLHDAQLDLDAEYYITKNIIPPLERIFNLVGANVRQWYDEMPKIHRIRRVEGTGGPTTTTTTTATKKDPKRTLESYMKSSSCIVCKTKKQHSTCNINGTNHRHRDLPICNDCMSQPHLSLLTLVSRLHQAEKRVVDLHGVCRSCMGVPFGDDVRCDSKDCPVFYSRTRHDAGWRYTKATLEPVVRMLEEGSESALDW